MKLLEGKSEISEEELNNVSGGVCYPDNPPCKYCNSTDTYTYWKTVGPIPVLYLHCRKCNADYPYEGD